MRDLTDRKDDVTGSFLNLQSVVSQKNKTIRSANSSRSTVLVPVLEF